MADTDRSAKIKLGSSGYSYPGRPPKGWYGVFYPEAKGKKFDELEYYSRFFDTVEINATFYRPPAPSMSKAWAGKTPAGFEFSVKVWQKFTHARKIGEVTVGADERWEAPTQADVDLFLKGIEPLLKSEKLGVLLFQYPAGFHFTKENVERLRWTLRAFKDHPKVVELRHRSWSERTDETKALLADLGAGWAVIDEPKFGSSIRQEFQPVGTIFYLRLHGRNRAKWWEHGEAWERYDYLYSEDEIRGFGEKIRAVMRSFPGCKAYVFFNNHARGQAAVNAIMLAHELGMTIRSAPEEAFVKAFPQISRVVPQQPQKALF